MTARLWNVYYDTLDCSVSIILRLLCLYFMTQVALVWGHPHTYDPIYSQSSKRTYTIQEIVLNLVMRAWKWITNIALRRDEQQVLKQRSSSDYKLTVNVEEILSKVEQKKKKGGEENEESTQTNNFEYEYFFFPPFFVIVKKKKKRRVNKIQIQIK
ncbi:hypothetical protein RFI_18517 [Reticulomyxa filosa]|uniref:Uncharacterized protein n=1 Tax=Reticulomyxa filosa TaxID=46433 RepID=X6MXI3_RETFI|nr:hypothetical protein RFI_18517 [Reticulomyxa filosa]|eukprot:ETO18735.1 hypothetical protein RFI_18517 [Reticulomyxa filosa]